LSIKALIIGGLEVPLLAALELQQDYEPIRATFRHRMGDGSLRQQTAWGGKIKTTISGRGHIPAGLQGLDYEQPLVLACVASRAITGMTNQLTLPAARRTDAPLLGRALLVDGRWQSTPVALVGDLATLDLVTGALQYQVLYLPEISVYAAPPHESKPRRGNDYAWTLTAEEI